MVILAIIVFACLLCGLFIPRDPAYMDLSHTNAAPDGEFWFGTDTMGRDVFFHDFLWWADILKYRLFRNGNFYRRCHPLRRGQRHGAQMAG